MLGSDEGFDNDSEDELRDSSRDSHHDGVLYGLKGSRFERLLDVFKHGSLDGMNHGV